MTANKYILVLCTCPSQQEADAVATALLEERLAACVNQLPGIRSLYRWEGRVTQDDEVLLLIKTSANLFGSLEKMIKKLHPYATPEIIAVPIIAGSAEYLGWIEESIE
ncbi:MAG: divalent-cation tolerance protein CutA [Gammaproteobacteria bacterium]|jgi:periplasmic divalent cation tolerance protein|nr:divalent-cation tolerance protein CutA [Gammaproteobacteria bacterium]